MKNRITNLSIDKNGISNKKRSKANGKKTANSVESNKKNVSTWYVPKKTNKNEH